MIKYVQLVQIDLKQLKMDQTWNLITNFFKIKNVRY